MILSPVFHRHVKVRGFPLDLKIRNFRNFDLICVQTPVHVSTSFISCLEINIVLDAPELFEPVVTNRNQNDCLNRHSPKRHFHSCKIRYPFYYNSI